MRARPVVIVGAGGFARETAETVHALRAHDGSVELRGFVDDDPSLHGCTLVGGRVLGGLAALADHPDAAVVVAVGRPGAYTTRRDLVARLDLTPDRWATLVHPDSSIGSSCRLGPGTVVLAQVVMTAAVVVGAHVAVMPQVVLTHDVVVESYATLASGVRLGGAAHVASGAYVGSGVCVREGCRVGAWAMVGMGSTVTRDVPDERLWFGSPAQDVRRAPLPWPEAEAEAESESEPASEGESDAGSRVRHEVAS
jgi:sugar O-acyltransferase (sialic acid O-acetyltransferase NeuD family)